MGQAIHYIFGANLITALFMGVLPAAARDATPALPGPEAGPKPEIHSVKPVPIIPAAPSSDADSTKADEAAQVPQVLRDTAILPAPVARLRAQLLDAARTGDIEKLRPILEGNDGAPIVSFGEQEHADPIEFWKSASGDGQGREILAILIEVLEADFTHVDAGTENELFVWPYFAQYPLKKLTPAQEVELYKLVTAQDKQDMDQFGAYNFYRAAISPDGRWRYFVAGD